MELLEQNSIDLSTATFCLLSLKADLEIPIPRYFISERSKEVKEQKTMLTEILKMVEVTESAEVS